MELKGTVEIEETYYKRSLELAFTDYLEPLNYLGTV